MPSDFEKPSFFYRPGMRWKMRHLFATFQKGKCAICKRLLSQDLRPAVDHDHVTGKVRGLLCMRCNLTLAAIEAYRRNPTPIDWYLDNTPASQMAEGDEFYSA